MRSTYMSFISGLLASLTFTLLAAPAVYAAADPDAEVVHLRTNCASVFTDVDVLGYPGTGKLRNCFESMDDLTSWIWGTRNPTAQTPLLVDIGPGTFGKVFCQSGSGDGWTTFRGSGPQQTIIDDPVGQSGAVAILGCKSLHFQDLTVRGKLYGVAVTGESTTTWTNVDIRAGGSGSLTGFGWYDQGPPPSNRGVHYFFSSRITSFGGGFVNAGMWVTHSEIWLYASEVTATWDGNYANPIMTQAAAWIVEGGEVRAFGSVMRSNLANAPDVQIANGLRAVIVGSSAKPGGVFHFHGGIVNASSAGNPNILSTAALEAAQGGFAHTPGAAFVVDADAGDAARAVSSGGTIASPFRWPAALDPPETEGGVAIDCTDGEDTFVETDCLNNGTCNGGTEPHTMVCSGQCISSGWFDQVTGACRP